MKGPIDEDVFKSVVSGQRTRTTQTAHHDRNFVHPKITPDRTRMGGVRDATILNFS